MYFKKSQNSFLVFLENISIQLRNVCYA